MSITIERFPFEGPFYVASQLNERSGIYVFFDYYHEEYSVLDIGESHFGNTRLPYHDRSACWARIKKKTIEYAALYTPNLQQTGRKKIEQELKEQYNPPCGER